MISTILITFLGLIIGYWLAFLTPEEFKSGKEYFKIIKKSLLLILVIIFLMPASNVLYTPLFFIIGFIAAKLFYKTYFYMGLALAISFFVSINFNTLVSSLIFIFGLAHGTLKANKYLKNKEKAIKSILIELIFFTIPLTILFFSFQINNTLSLIAGALFFIFISKDQ